LKKNQAGLFFCNGKMPLLHSTAECNNGIPAVECNNGIPAVATFNGKMPLLHPPKLPQIRNPKKLKMKKVNTVAQIFINS